MDKEKEYIERDKALRVVNCECEAYAKDLSHTAAVLIDRDDINDRLLKLPAADVAPVVRCRDCVFNQRECKDGKIDCYKNLRLVEPEHFCGWGRRRENSKDEKA